MFDDCSVKINSYSDIPQIYHADRNYFRKSNKKEFMI